MNKFPAQCFHPGEFVKDEMDARGWNVSELAKQMSVHNMPVNIVQSIIDCKQNITPNIAFGLKRAFGTSVDFWMNAQKMFDIWEELQECCCPADGHSELCPVHKVNSSPR